MNSKVSKIYLRCVVCRIISSWIVVSALSSVGSAAPLACSPGSRYGSLSTQRVTFNFKCCYVVRLNVFALHYNEDVVQFLLGRMACLHKMQAIATE